MFDMGQAREIPDPRAHPRRGAPAAGTLALARVHAAHAAPEAHGAPEWLPSVSRTPAAAPVLDYLSATAAPTSSSLAFISSASSLVAASLTVLGAPSTSFLGLLQAQAGELAHHLDDLDLLVADALENDVELVLLLGRGFAAAAGRPSPPERPSP